VEDLLLPAVARLGALALDGVAPDELRSEVLRVASSALEADVAFDAGGKLTVASRPLVSREHDFLQAVAHILAGADQHGRAQLHDPLTGLPNRYLLADRVAGALARLRRGSWRVAVLCVDIDRLKVLNETLGQRAGDDLLRAVGPRLLDALRPDDTVARFGGGGFGVLCEGIADEAHAARVASRIVEAFAAPFVIDGVKRRVSASVGVALAAAGQSPEGLIANAEAAMYRAKQRGRARLELHDAKLRAKVAARARMEDELRLALDSDSNDLWVAYQPIHHLRGGIFGVEALGRWTHPALGNVPPAEFIPVAEDAGLIGALGERILLAACRQVAAWRELAPDLVLSVNLSAHQVAPGIARTVAKALGDSGLPGDALWLELTEGLLLEDSDGTIETLQALRELGVRLALDDFGTGYSSLSYLRRYPIDVLKIDRAFISDRALLAAIAGMARALGLDIVAEGVENAGQLAYVTELDCDYVQGFFFARPLPAERLEEFLRSGALASAA
jgi:diguanylate cyclase (GGDEF)-like protein